MMALALFLLQCIFMLAIFILFLHSYTKKCNKPLLWNFPLLGIIPDFLLNFHRLHDKLTEVLERSHGSLLIKPSWFAQNDLFLTSDPANVHHIMNTNFQNYPKGPIWRERFDIFGDDGIFNSDFEAWKLHRKMAQALFSHQKFRQLAAKTMREITQKGLIPALERVSEQNKEFDLKDLLNRATFDFACIITTGYNPNFLSMEQPEVPFVKAIDDACEAIFFRYVLPERLWKLQRWMGIGKERKLSNGWRSLDGFWEECLSYKREKMSEVVATTSEDEDEESVIDLLDCYLSGNEVTGPTPNEKVMRDNVIGLILGAEGAPGLTLAWFFWLLSKNNPLIEAKIREEITENLPLQPMKCTMEDLSKLVYLHAALCEALRLFPPVPFQLRKNEETDTLPSGHEIKKNTDVLISMYAIGRMRTVWGEDCYEFKPERWISEDGSIKHVPPQKFFAFNAGPRICPGKEIGFNLLKIIVATVIQNYEVQILENQVVIPNNLSISNHINGRLMARIKKRS